MLSVCTENNNYVSLQFWWINTFIFVYFSLSLTWFCWVTCVFSKHDVVIDVCVFCVGDVLSGPCWCESVTLVSPDLMDTPSDKHVSPPASLSAFVGRKNITALSRYLAAGEVIFRLWSLRNHRRILRDVTTGSSQQLDASFFSIFIDFIRLRRCTGSEINSTGREESERLWQLCSFYKAPLKKLSLKLIAADNGGGSLKSS